MGCWEKRGKHSPTRQTSGRVDLGLEAKEALRKGNGLEEERMGGGSEKG